jgi:periplasmic protein TonB
VTGRALRIWLYTGSAVFHGALSVGAYLLPKEQHTESVAIELADIKKKNEKPKPPPPPPPPPPKEKPKPPPPPPPPPQTQAKAAREPAKAEAPALEPLGADGFADLGSVALGNGGTGGGGGEGVALAAPGRLGAAAAPKAKAITRRVEQLAPAVAQACTEPDVSPRHISQVLPKMTREAQQAEIEGVVLIEVTIDPSGSVLDARIIRGLGYGLDEAALRAAKAWTFQPATRCGKAIVGHKKIPFRFTLT